MTGYLCNSIAKKRGIDTFVLTQRGSACVREQVTIRASLPSTPEFLRHNTAKVQRIVVVLGSRDGRCTTHHLMREINLSISFSGVGFVGRCGWCAPIGVVAPETDRPGGILPRPLPPMPAGS